MMYQHGLGYTRYPTATNDEYKYWGWYGPTPQLPEWAKAQPASRQMLVAALAVLLIPVFAAVAIVLAPYVLVVLLLLWALS
jgi:hypothetical protein